MVGNTLRTYSHFINRSAWMVWTLSPIHVHYIEGVLSRFFRVKFRLNCQDYFYSISGGFIPTMYIDIINIMKHWCFNCYTATFIRAHTDRVIQSKDGEITQETMIRLLYVFEFDLHCTTFPKLASNGLRLYSYSCFDFEIEN